MRRVKIVLYTAMLIFTPAVSAHTSRLVPTHPAPTYHPPVSLPPPLVLIKPMKTLAPALRGAWELRGSSAGAPRELMDRQNYRVYGTQET